MFLKLFVLFCVFANSFAWLPPERCTKRNLLSWPPAHKFNATLVNNVEEIAAKQQESLIEAYKNFDFIGVPIKVVHNSTSKNTPKRIKIYAPYNCSFQTFEPRMICAVDCSEDMCWFASTVSIIDTYNASDGHNWAVKFSSKFEKTFEVGGELSSDETYNCTHFTENATCQVVVCSDLDNTAGYLQLYYIQSDLVCDIGEIEYELKMIFEQNVDELNDLAKLFTLEELESLKASANVYLEDSDFFIMDISLVSNNIMKKLNKINFNPYNDLLQVNTDNITVNYYKRSSAPNKKYRRVIPFSNENDDSVHQYVCVMKTS